MPVRTFNLVFILLAVLSCTSIAMIWAMPTGNGTPAHHVLHHRQFESSPQRCEAIAGLCDICAQIDENKLQPQKICDSKTCTAANKLYIFWCKESNATARTSRVRAALTRVTRFLLRPRPPALIPIYNNSSATSVNRHSLTY